MFETDLIKKFGPSMHQTFPPYYEKYIFLLKIKQIKYFLNSKIIIRVQYLMRMTIMNKV